MPIVLFRVRLLIPQTFTECHQRVGDNGNDPSGWERRQQRDARDGYWRGSQQCAIKPDCGAREANYSQYCEEPPPRDHFENSQHKEHHQTITVVAYAPRRSPRTECANRLAQAGRSCNRPSPLPESGEGIWGWSGSVRATSCRGTPESAAGGSSPQPWPTALPRWRGWRGGRRSAGRWDPRRARSSSPGRRRRR